MELQPLRETTPQRYPRRRHLPQAGAWVRGILVAVGASAAIMTGGCVEGLLPIGGERLAGDVAMVSMFGCADEVPAEPRMLQYPGVHDGELCGDQTAFAALDVEQSEELSFSFTYGDNVVIHVIDPSGLEVGELSSNDEESLTLELTAGRWLIAATPLDAENPWGMFALSIDEAAP